MLCAMVSAVSAAPVTYQIDPTHTYPSFAADHFGVSTWRGKFTKSAGSVIIDRAAGRGDIHVTIEAASIEFGLPVMNAQARGDQWLDVARFPQATYKGTLVAFVNGAPTRATGELTLHGVTKPLELSIQKFKCLPHPLNKREWCGADAVATFDREAFGIAWGKQYGIDMAVTLQIQVEAFAVE
jgi:polyisoprenoid-binding protein YceI